MDNVIDTRDLINKREELMQAIIEDAESKFFWEFTDYEEIESFFNDEVSEHLTEEQKCAFSEYWQDEINHIAEIDNIETEIGSEFTYGTPLIDEDYWVEYVEEELIKGCGDLPQDIPWYIEIDWDKTANNIRIDYGSIRYQDNTYYYRMS